MPNYEVGGVEVAVEPSFRGFRRKLREGLVEEERLARDINIEAEPKLTAGFRRELSRLVRAASAGIKVEVEASPGLTKGYRTELNRLVREASTGIRVDIEATPSLSGNFRTSLTRAVRAATSGITIEVEAHPEISADFRTRLRTAVQRASTGVTVGVEVFPTVGRNFRVQAQRRITAAMTGVFAQVELRPDLVTAFRTQARTLVERSTRALGAKVVMAPALAPRFRTELRALVAKSTRGVLIRIPLYPQLARGFRRLTEALVKKEMSRYRANIELRPVLGRNFRARMKALADSQTAFEAKIEVVTDTAREIRRKLLEAVRQATTLPPLVARVHIVPDIKDLRTKTQAAMRSVNRVAKITPSIDGNTLRRRTLSDVSQAMAAANRIARINITTVLRNTAGKGLTALTTSLRGVTRAARLATIGLGALAVGIGAVGAAGLKSSADFEFTRTNFGILLQDAQKGEEVFQSLVRAARESIYELPDLQPLVQNLLVVNKLLPETLPFENVQEILTDVTDLGAALDITAPAMTRLGLAFAKIAGRGKLTGEELRSISKNAPGLNAIQLIADDLGVTVPEAFAKIREGAVSSDEALRILLTGIKNFPGAAGAGLKEVTETFKGAMSNLADILRFEFFEAFDEHLPAITKVIGPDGPLVRAFRGAAPAIAEAFVPLVQTFFNSIADFTHALRSAFQVTVPIFVQLGRATETVGLQIRRMFDAIGPSLGELAESFATLLAGISPILPVVGELVALFANQLTRVIDGLIGSGAVDVILGLFEGLQGALENLLPILGDVVTAIGEALLQALEDIDLDQLGESLGLLAEAFGDLFVALAPVIPELVEIVAIFAEAMVPAIEASIPLLVGLIDVLVPIARVLASLGPGILILYGIGKAALSLATGVTLVARFAGGLANLADTLNKTKLAGGGTLGQKLGITNADGALQFTERLSKGLKAVAGVAAATAAAMTAYFAAASSDITTQIAGIATSVGSIATAFAVAGPIAGGFALAAAGIGAVLGNMAKKAREAKEELAFIDDLGDSFASAFKEIGSTTFEKRLIALVSGFKGLLESANDTADALAAKDFFGRFRADELKAAEAMARGTKAFREYATGVRDQRLDEIFRGNRDTIKAFGEEVGDAGLHLARFGEVIAGGRQSSALRDLGERFAEGGISTQELTDKIIKLGFSSEIAGRLVGGMKREITADIGQSPAVAFFEGLPEAIKKVIREQDQVRRLNELLKTDQQKLGDAFNLFSGAVDNAANSLRAYNDLKSGKQASIDQAYLNSINLAKELIDIDKQRAEGAITAQEAEAQQRQLIFQNSQESSGAIARLLVEARGNYSVFKDDVQELRAKTLFQLTADFVKSGLKADEAAKRASHITDELYRIPDETQFNIDSNAEATAAHLRLINLRIQALDRIKIPELRLRIREEYLKDPKRPGNVERLVEFSAAGRLVRKPMLSVVGEEGPELILPLNDPARMSALIKEAMDAGLLKGAPAVTAALPPVAATAPVNVGFAPTVDPEVGAEFTKQAADSVAGLGDQLVQGTDPGLDRWRGKVSTHLDTVVSRMTVFGADSKSSLTRTVNDLASIATVGSAGVVNNLSAGLDRGTTAVKRIVRSYARSLAGGINPVLDAIGQPKIDLGQFRKGGLNDPRIVPDGSYNVHVFGERGTKGEAYIPFDPKLRPSSRAIADETVRRLGGRAEWFRGGGITGDKTGMHPEFLRRLERWSESVGTPYNIDSGWRSFEAQQRLYQRWLAGVPGQAQAAPPGKSMHNFGLASDGNRWRDRNPQNYGLRYPMDFEPWHVEPNEARTWAAMGDRFITIVPLPKPPSAGTYGQLSITGKKLMDVTYMQALAWAGKQAMTSLPGDMSITGSGPRAAQAAQWARQAMGLTGVPGHWLSGLLTLMRRESNFDPRAINLWDSNARRGFPTKGITQMRQDTFLAHALPGMTDIWNPVHIIASTIRYILAKYDDISNVQQANPGASPRGYEHGAIVNHEHMARVAEKNKPEVIIPLTNPVRARALADASGVTTMVRERDAAAGPKYVIEKGAIQVDVKAPSAETPEAYAASMSNRLLPAVQHAIERALP